MKINKEGIYKGFIDTYIFYNSNKQLFVSNLQFLKGTIREHGIITKH